MTQFKKDLIFGQYYERMYLEYIKYNSVIFSNKKEYDILIDNNIKVEVKSDRLAYKTGNLAIEYNYKNQPSGIMTSMSNYWVYFIIYPNNKHECYKIPIDELKFLIQSCKSINAGDNKQSKIKLLPISRCKEYLINKIN